MMSREQNDQLSRVGPGTFMGKLLRRYWAPFLLASEIPEPDCPPVRVKLIQAHGDGWIVEGIDDDDD